MGAARTRPRSWTAPAHWLGAARRPPANGAGRAGRRAAAVNPLGTARGGGSGGGRGEEEEGLRPERGGGGGALGSAALITGLIGARGRRGPARSPRGAPAAGPRAGCAAERNAVGGRGPPVTWAPLWWAKPSYRMRGRPRALVLAAVACVLPRHPQPAPPRQPESSHSGPGGPRPCPHGGVTRRSGTGGARPVSSGARGGGQGCAVAHAGTRAAVAAGDAPRRSHASVAPWLRVRRCVRSHPGRVRNRGVVPAASPGPAALPLLPPAGLDSLWVTLKKKKSILPEDLNLFFLPPLD